MKKIRCFIAMKFGSKDTDKIYDDCIIKVLDEINFEPRRIDRIIHNQRIDEKIRREIKNADIVIADLTYARPSVYWESGYAERKVPVVYTCRNDHFRDKEDDPNGNLKVHFDLSNANIISWNPNTDNFEFKNKLKATLLLETKDLIIEKEHEQAKIKSESEFKRMSVLGRMRKTDDLAKNVFATDTKLDFIEEIYRKHIKYESRYKVIIKKTYFDIHLLYPSESWIKKEIKDFLIHLDKRETKRFENYQSVIFGIDRRKVKKYREIYIIHSLKKIPESRLESALLEWGSINEKYFYLNHIGYLHFNEKERKNTSLELIIIDDIKSEYGYKDLLKNKINFVFAFDIFKLKKY